MPNHYSKGLFRPVALTVAGFDPSAGAGLLADIKTFEAHQVYGLAVMTGYTFQNDRLFAGVDWQEKRTKEKNLSLLANRMEVQAIKLGMHKDLNDVWHTISECKEKFPDAQIIWDPVLSASAGFDLNISIGKKQLHKIMESIQLITPNRQEILRLCPETSAEEAALRLSAHTAILLKGGHSEGTEATDLLYQRGKLIESYSHSRLAGEGKHGSGCVLSSAITAQLAKGNTLTDAMKKAKDYTLAFLSSNPTLLGYHFNESIEG